VHIQLTRIQFIAQNVGVHELKKILTNPTVIGFPFSQNIPSLNCDEHYEAKGARNGPSYQSVYRAC